MDGCGSLDQGKAETSVSAIRLALALVKPSEGLCLRAYPDPASPLSRALSARGILRAYKAGTASIPDDLRALSGAPWTIGYGETEGVTEDMVWTPEQAELRLIARLTAFASGVLKRCPQLAHEPDSRFAACISFAYNIGLGAFGASSVCRCTKRREYMAAANAFRLWNKAGGRVMAGLTARREAERALYLTAEPMP
jgi:lysozyme